MVLQYCDLLDILIINQKQTVDLRPTRFQQALEDQELENVKIHTNQPGGNLNMIITRMPKSMQTH